MSARGLRAALEAASEQGVGLFLTEKGVREVLSTYRVLERVVAGGPVLTQSQRILLEQMEAAGLLCQHCRQPTLPPGLKRHHPHDFRHARGCPAASPSEHRMTERLWKRHVR